MKLINIGFGNMVSAQRLIAIVSPDSAPMKRLVQKAKTIDAWRDGKPNILVIAPPHIGEGLYNIPAGEGMGAGCPEKSRQLAPRYAEVCERQGCAFLDAEGIGEFNNFDCMHLTAKGHRNLAAKLAELVPELVK